MAEIWPPLVDADTEWRTQAIRVRSDRWPFGMEQEMVRLRRVKLWGREEWIDAEGRVCCGGCLELVSLDELSRTGNGHLPSPVASPVEGVVRSWSVPQETA